MNLKKWEGIYELICWDRALVLWKKNLPSHGLTKVEKHCSRLRWVKIHLNQFLMPDHTAEHLNLLTILIKYQDPDLRYGAMLVNE